MQSVVGVPYDFNKPWPFRFYISKIVSKAFFDDEEQLEWLNTVRVQTSEFIAFTNNAKQSASSKLESHTDKTELRVVEVDFSKPQPGEYLRFFWKPARGIICQKVQGCKWRILFLDLDNLILRYCSLDVLIYWPTGLDFSSNGLQKAPPLVESTHSILTSGKIDRKVPSRVRSGTHQRDLP
jgi:hypothetical protein